jgi:hypothetical protein
MIGGGRRRSTTRRSRLGGFAVLGVVASIVLGVSCSDGSEAAWMSRSYITGTVRAGVLNPVPTVKCGTAGGLLSTGVPISWTAPATGSDALTPQNYTVNWSGTAGSGNLTVPASATSATIPGSTLALLGSSTVSIRASFAGWLSPPSLETRTIATLIGAGGLVVAWSCA